MATCPPHIGTLESQRERRNRGLVGLSTSLEKYRFMRDLQDTNETLFYSLITHQIEETLPIVYTPTVGEACQKFSEIWRKPRGLFLSYPNKGRIEQILSSPLYDGINAGGRMFCCNGRILQGKTRSGSSLVIGNSSAPSTTTSRERLLSPRAHCSRRSMLQASR